MLDIPDEKKIILNAIRAKNNICIAGAAGTGKSFMLSLIKDFFPHVHITASTGVAAVNIGGVTIHSWAGIGNGSLPINEIVKFINSGPGTKIRRQIKKAKMLAIDEISMISAQTLNLLNEVFKAVRENEHPFGGIQMILLGDFFQLPPVTKEEEIDFCFEAEAWEEGGFKLFELTEVFRQSDLKFIQLLNNIRFAALNNDDIGILSSREIVPNTENVTPTILVTHNFQAEKINKEKLEDLIGEEEYIYNMVESGKENAILALKKGCLAPEKLILKKGAQVMMLKNTLQKHGIINGSIGIITGFYKNKIPIVKFRNGEIQLISPEEWCIEVFNEITQQNEVIASIKQIPLTLAWAFTIHKSQGMTLDSVFCDLSQVFAEGQSYVAISRVRSIEGLYIKGFSPEKMRIHHKVRKFYLNNFVSH